MFKLRRRERATFQAGCFELRSDEVHTVIDGLRIEGRPLDVILVVKNLIRSGAFPSDTGTATVTADGMHGSRRVSPPVRPYDQDDEERWDDDPEGRP